MPSEGAPASTEIAGVLANTGTGATVSEGGLASTGIAGARGRAARSATLLGSLAIGSVPLLVLTPTVTATNANAPANDKDPTISDLLLGSAARHALHQGSPAP
jgi:hypothetical protein